MRRDDNEYRKVLDANIRFHTALANQDAYKDQPFLSEQNRKRVRHILESLVSRAPCADLLDIGTGTGFIPSVGADIFSTMVGIDITPAMMVYAKKIEGLHLFKATGEGLPFVDNSFGIVTSYGVLHHFHVISDVLKEAARCLMQGGFFYADESPNAVCIKSLQNLDLDDSGSKVLTDLALAVRHDNDAYEKRYGFSKSLAENAMHQNKEQGGVDLFSLRDTLRLVGFSKVEIRPRWFLGQGMLEENKASTLDDYLLSMTPLTLPLYKYFSVIAVK